MKDKSCIIITFLILMYIIYSEKFDYIILLLSALLMYFFLKSIRPFVISKKWIKIPAEITEIGQSYKEIALSEYQNIKYYFPEITYKYQYKNKIYQSDCVSYKLENVWIPEVDKWGNNIDNASYFWSSWKKGKIIDIYVNPLNPAQAVIIREISSRLKSHFLALSISAFLLFITWLGIKYILSI